MISDEIDEDEDDDAATHVIASRDVLGDLAELAESDFAPPRRPTPPPVPSRVPLPAPPRATTHVQPAWAADEGEYDETLTYGEGQADDDDVPTRGPPDVAPREGAHPQFSPLQPVVATGSFRPVAPAAYEPHMPIPYERTAVSPRDDELQRRTAAAAGPDLATKLLLSIIVLLAAALAVVLVLIARR